MSEPQPNLLHLRYEVSPKALQLFHEITPFFSFSPIPVYKPQHDSMSTVKANNYLGVLDAARCNGEWDGILEHARKVQKHAPGRKCLALTASTEAKLYRLPHLGVGSTADAIANYHAVLTALQGPLQAELDSHSNVASLPSPSGGAHSMVTTPDDILQARTILSWLYSRKGDWETALRIIPGEDEVGESWVGGGKGDYIGVIRIKALVLKGIALAHQSPDDLSLPLQNYRAATKLPATYTPAQQTSASFLLWTEKALSHHALTAYSCWLDNHILPGESSEGEETPEMQEYVAQEVGMADGRTTIDEASVARAFRSFHQFVAGLSSSAHVQIGLIGAVPAAIESGLNTEKELERREVYRNYFKFISLLLLPEGHPDRPIPRKPPSFKPEAGRTISVVPTNSPPTGMMHKAGTTEVLKAELKVVEHVYEEYLLRGLNFPRADEYHGAIGEWVDLVVQDWRVGGGSGEEALAVVEILYRAATKTFHSPRILRHLFTALTAVGNFPDAVRSLDTYVDLVQRAKDRIAKGHIEKDIDDDKTILETTVEGIRVLCGLVGDARKGMALAERIERWIDEWRVRDDDMLVSVYRGIGTANATWARNTIDGDSRPDIQRAAVRAFEKALTHDQFDIDVWYGLALVQLEVGDIDSAMESTKKGLVIVKYLTEEEFDDAWDGRRDYKRRTVPLLHLLSLLMTVTENFEEARQACANVFEILGEDMSVFRGMGIGEKESVLEVRMTQIAIEEALDGAEVAVKMADHLLDIYGRLFEAAQLDHSIRSLHDNGQLDNPPHTRQNTTNRKPRLLGGRRKSIFSTTVSSLPPEEFIGDSGNIRPISGHQSLRQSTALGSGPDAPQIQVTDVHGGAYQNDNLLKKTGRPSSVSSGTIRRMKSFSSMRSGKGDHGRIPIPDVPTPPLPSGTNTSSASVERSPAGSVKENHHHNTHLFQMLKLKLHKHQLQDMGTAGSPSEPLSHIGSTTSFMTNDSSITPMDSAAEGHMGREAPRAEDIPNNLSQSKLPYPIRALRSGITDEIGKDAKPRSIRRPKQLPEPKLHEEDEKRRALAALRKVWIFIGGLARRSKDFGGATYALGEADALIGLKGEGEADVWTERGFLAMEEEKKTVAIECFNAAIALDDNHPLAIVGLCQLLLQIPAAPTPIPVVTPANNEVDVAARPSTSSSSVIAAKSPNNSVSEDELNLSSLASINRALGLLEHLTATSHGWDIPEAWFALARAYELLGEMGRAKRSLWRCVELEDARAVRAWCNLKPRIL